MDRQRSPIIHRNLRHDSPSFLRGGPPDHYKDIPCFDSHPYRIPTTPESISHPALTTPVSVSRSSSTTPESISRSSFTQLFFYLFVSSGTPTRSFLLHLLLYHGLYTRQEQECSSSSSCDDQGCKAEGRNQGEASQNQGHYGDNHQGTPGAPCRPGGSRWRVVLQGALSK